MKRDTKTASPWMSLAMPTGAGALAADTEADVCVVGAGIAGLTTAYNLAREGKSVVVLERLHVGSGMTGRTTAHINSALDETWAEIERVHGAKTAALAAESHVQAIDEIEGLVRLEDIECDFERVDGYLITPPGEPSDVLQQELEACRRAGLSDVHMVERIPFTGFDSGRALCFPGQAQFHPLRYLAGLARACERHGVRIFTNSRVHAVEGGRPAVAVTSHGPTVTASDIVLCTNTPITDLANIHTRQHAYLSYVIGGLVPRGSVPRIQIWDTEDPYHYARVHPYRGGTSEQPSYDLLIVGGEDHRTGQADDGHERFARLVHWTRQRFPMLQDVTHRWCGEIMEPADQLPFIGPDPSADNIYIVTGDSGDGMTNGTLGGMIVRDLLLGRENRWAPIYDPSRVSVMAAIEYARENLNTMAQYTDWLTGSEAEDVQDIPRGQGAIMRRGLQKVAVYRDEDGHVLEMSATCRHLGCVVAWNSTDGTWDCPCHGSRYRATGEVFQGPACQNLKLVRERESSEGRRPL